MLIAKRSSPFRIAFDTINEPSKARPKTVMPNCEASWNVATVFIMSVASIAMARNLPSFVTARTNLSAILISLF